MPLQHFGSHIDPAKIPFWYEDVAQLTHEMRLSKRIREVEWNGEEESESECVERLSWNHMGFVDALRSDLGDLKIRFKKTVKFSQQGIRRGFFCVTKFLNAPYEDPLSKFWTQTHKSYQKLILDNFSGSVECFI